MVCILKYLEFGIRKPVTNLSGVFYRDVGIGIAMPQLNWAIDGLQEGPPRAIEHAKFLDGPGPVVRERGNEIAANDFSDFLRNMVLIPVDILAHDEGRGCMIRYPGLGPKYPFDERRQPSGQPGQRPLNRGRSFPKGGWGDPTHEMKVPNPVRVSRCYRQCVRATARKPDQIGRSRSDVLQHRTDERPSIGQSSVWPRRRAAIARAIDRDYFSPSLSCGVLEHRAQEC